MPPRPNRTSTSFLRDSVAAVAVTVLLAAAGGCSVYRAEVVQGSDRIFERVDSLEDGFSKEQVREALGPPHVIGAYRPERWHYVSDMRGTGTPGIRKVLVVTFDGDGSLVSAVLTEEPNGDDG